MSAHRIAWSLGSGLLSCSLLACAAELGGSGEVPSPGADAGESAAPDADLSPPRTEQNGGSPSEAGAQLDAEAVNDGGIPTQDDAALALDAARDVSPPEAGPLEAGSDAAADGAASDAQAADAIVCTRGPIDLVWAIDGSTSMLGEISQISSQLVRLVAILQEAGADVRTTVLSPFDPVALNEDVALPSYHFVMADIQKDNVLSGLLGNFSSYAQWLRPGVRTDLLVASDEDSSLAASSFQAQMQALLGHPFSFHAIAAPSSIFGVCSTAEEAGAHYEALASQTDGVFLSICTSDWTGTFNTLAAGIMSDAPLLCH